RLVAIGRQEPGVCPASQRPGPRAISVVEQPTCFAGAEAGAIEQTMIEREWPGRVEEGMQQFDEENVRLHACLSKPFEHDLLKVRPGAGHAEVKKNDVLRACRPRGVEA